MRFTREPLMLPGHGTDIVPLCICLLLYCHTITLPDLTSYVKWKETKKRLTHTHTQTQSFTHTPSDSQITHWDVTQPAECLSPQVWRLLCTATRTFLPDRYAALLTEEEEVVEEEDYEEDKENVKATLKLYLLSKLWLHQRLLRTPAGPLAWS